ncbi:MAG TPA: BrxA/BrxB family bacilliredoxin [Planctomycetes bacterium]|nr:BrxA/BrxB family bacilliredoxin [Planctomycetota bacterium]HIN80801.1 BrxA/BrxB family bacilliredoxin [Planctomycetota bacterium]
MPYPEEMVAPMRRELSDNGVSELKSAEEVDVFFEEQTGTGFVIVNSVCGCAAGGARPGALLALQSEVCPDRVATVFAGQDTEATARVREKFGDVPPSSPSMGLFSGGELVWYLPRHMIEGRDPQSIAFEIVAAFEAHCQKAEG